MTSKARPARIEASVPDHSRLGKLIVFEGPDGVGKSTLSLALAERLAETGIVAQSGGSGIRDRSGRRVTDSTAFDGAGGTRYTVGIA